MSYASGRLTYGGVSIPVWNSAIAGWVERQIPLKDYVPFDTAGWYAHDLWHLNLPSPYQLPHPVEIGVVRWPTRASNWAVGNFVVNGRTVLALRTAVGQANDPLPLVLDTTCASGMVSSLFYMLPPRRLLVGTRTPPQTAEASASFTVTMASTDDLWIVTLVDERFFWWRRPVTTAEGSWADLFSTIGSELGLTISHPSVPSAYLTPTERFNAFNVPAPMLLDAAAESVGMRLVRGLDGTVALQQWHDALNADRSWQARSVAPVSGYTGWGKIMGGGQMVSVDIVRTLPPAVRVVFGRKDASGNVLADQYVSDQSLDAITAAGGLLGDYFQGTSGWGRLGDYGRFTADAYATPDASGAPGNVSTLSALAFQAASDWYGWQLGEVDVELPGVIPWEQDAMAATVRWTYEEDRVSTRVARDPYFDPNVYGAYPGAVGGGGGVSSEWRPYRITGRTPAAIPNTPPIYQGVEVELTSGISPTVGWQDKSGGDSFDQGIRMPNEDIDENHDSEELLAIPIGQTVFARPSPTLDGYYEIAPWGGTRKTIIEHLYRVCTQCVETSPGIFKFRTKMAIRMIEEHGRSRRALLAPSGSGELNLE